MPVLQLRFDSSDMMPIWMLTTVVLTFLRKLRGQQCLQSCPLLRSLKSFFNGTTLERTRLNGRYLKFGNVAVSLLISG